MTVFKQPPIILASGSPRRKKLLKQINLEFQVKPSSVHEDFSIGLPPPEFAEYYALQKALSISDRYPGHLIVGADTIVVLDNKILGKPKNETDSFNMLMSLSGRKHDVITGVAIVWKEKAVNEKFHETTSVSFHKLKKEEVKNYITQYQPFDKAGSYGIQDWFSVCVKKINGCFYNVMGFPLSTFYQRYQKIIRPGIVRNH